MIKYLFSSVDGAKSMQKMTLKNIGLCLTATLTLMLIIDKAYSYFSSEPNPNNKYCESIIKLASGITTKGGEIQEDNDDFRSLTNGKLKVYTNEEVSNAASEFIQKLNEPNVSKKTLRKPRDKINNACKKFNS